MSIGALFIALLAIIAGCGHSISGAQPPGPPPPAPPEYAFVSNSADSVISSFKVNSKTGALTFADSATAGAAGGARGLVVAHKGQFLYVANQDSAEIFGFTIDKSNGHLSPTGQKSISTGAGTAPLTLAVSPDNFLYALDYANNQVLSYSISTSSGALKSLGAPVATGRGPVSMVVTPQITAGFVANSIDGTLSGYSIAKNGTLTASGSIASLGTVAGEPLWLVSDATGANLYVADAMGLAGGVISAFTISGATLAFVNVFSTGNTTGFPLSLTVSPTLPFIYVANGANNNLSKLTIQTGGLAPATLIPGITSANSIASAPNGKFLYITDQSGGMIFQNGINATTGDLVPVAPASIPTESPANPASSPFQIVVANASN
ncbi:MAG: lactonase family protein [Candidatus Binataceae bacterium]